MSTLMRRRRSSGHVDALIVTTLVFMAMVVVGFVAFALWVGYDFVVSNARD